MGQTPDEAKIEKAIAEDLPPLFDYLEGEIGDREFLVGNRLSIGDIGVCTQLVNLGHAGVGVDAKRWPKLAAYVGRILDRPSFKDLRDEEKKALGG